MPLFYKNRYQKRRLRCVKYEVREEWLKNGKQKLETFLEQAEKLRANALPKVIFIKNT